MGFDDLIGFIFVAGLLGGVPLLALAVIAITALVQVGNLRRRVLELERRAGAVSPAPVERSTPAATVRAESALATAAAVQAETGAARAAAAASAPALVSVPERKDSLEVKFGSGCLAGIGGLAIVIGVGFFFQYAFEHNWLGPVARVLLGLFWGCLFLIGGELGRSWKFTRTGLAATGAGLAILYFSSYAAYGYYHLISKLPAFGFMALVTLLAVGLAARYNARTVAALGLLGGMLTPVMLSTGENALFALSGYLLVLVLGFLLLAHFRDWQWLNCLAFFGTAALLGGWAEAHYTRAQFAPALMVFSGFSLLFLLLAVWRPLLSLRPITWLDLLLMFANAALYFGCGAGMVENWNKAYTGVFALVVAAGYIVFALLVRQRLQADRKLVTVSAGLAITFLSLVFPLHFDDDPVIFAWIVEGLLLFLLGAGLRMWQLRLGSFIVLAIALLRLLAYGSAVTYGPPAAFALLTNARAMLFMAFIVSAYIVIGCYRYWRDRLPLGEKTQWRAALLVMVQLITLWALAMENSDYFRHRRAYSPARLAQEQGWQDINELYRDIATARDRAQDYNLPADERDRAQRELLALEAQLELRQQERSEVPDDYRTYRDNRDAEQLTYSLILGGYAALLLLAGLLGRSAVLRLTAVVLFIAVIGKVFFIDLSSLDTIYRIISFIVLGFILLGVSLLYTLFRKQVNAFVLADGEEKGHA